MLFRNYYFGHNFGRIFRNSKNTNWFQYNFSENMSSDMADINSIFVDFLLDMSTSPFIVATDQGEIV